MRYFALLWSNLKRKKLRTSLTLLSILVAFLLFGLLCALKEALTGGVALAGTERLFVHHKTSFLMLLPVAHGQRMAQLPDLAGVTHMTWFGGVFQAKPKEFFANFPVEPEPFMAMYPEFALPPEQMQAWLKTRTGAIIGADLAKRFKWKIGDRVPLVSSIWPRKGADVWEFDIVGIYSGTKKSADQSGFYFRYDYFDEAREEGEGKVGWYMAWVKDPRRAAEASAAIDALFVNSAYETKSETEAAMAQGFAEQMGNIGAMTVAILSAVFFTILLVAGNTMAQSVRERTEELGVLKALGFTNELVLVLVLAESCLIAAVGGGAGLGAAWLATAGGSPVPSILPIFYVPHRDWAIGGGLVLALGLVTGIVPAIQAMRLQTAVALRRHV
jgi:putative ABC transport system permease protein